MQGDLSHERNVRLSVKRVNCDKTKEIRADILISHERPFILVSRKRNGWWRTTLSSLNFGWNWPGWSENADFQSIFGRSTLAVTPIKKRLINTNRKSTTRFPMSLRWTSYVAPQKRSIHAKMFRGGRLLLRENLPENDSPLEKRQFSIDFARSASAVTSSRKRSINTNRKYTTRLPMSPRWTSYVAPQKRSIQNLNNNLR